MVASDDSISCSIKSLIDDSMKDTSQDIHVNVQDNNVFLSGCVNVLAEKFKAEEICKKVQGVKNIENDITISMDGNFSDKELTEVLNKNLRKCEHSEKINGITGKVNGGSALLLGEVDTIDDKKLAINEAAKTFGIKDVVNNINIGRAKI
ncbi:BON domain-containing protein [Clostridium sp. CT7]|uniref:BON domain-containing protein n=2 Tax=Clostridium TaxID=1485 RepID=UPI0008240936|nr:BON domain-containing protein [Clostridium sp. CT7]PJI07912.1 BON domain-containing protein [Clostridium sp. CT7]